MGCVYPATIDDVPGRARELGSVESARGNRGRPYSRERETPRYYARDRRDRTSRDTSTPSRRRDVSRDPRDGSLVRIRAGARAVTSARPAPGEAVTRVTVETRPGKTRDALSSEVFSFADAVEDDRETGSSDDRETGSSDDRETRCDRETASDDRRRSSDDRRRSSDRTSPPSSSGVTPEELSSAVREMLTRAGAPPRWTRRRCSRRTSVSATDCPPPSPRPRARRRTVRRVRGGGRCVSRVFTVPSRKRQRSDPVVALDGHTYERRAIEQWFSQGRLTSPVTNLRLPATTLVPNHALKSAADAMEDPALARGRPRESDDGDGERDGERDGTHRWRVDVRRVCRHASGHRVL